MHYSLETQFLRKNTLWETYCQSGYRDIWQECFVLFTNILKKYQVYFHFSNVEDINGYYVTKRSVLPSFCRTIKVLLLKGKTYKT